MASQFSANDASNGPDPSTTEALAKILSELNEMKLKNAQLEHKVSGKLNKDFSSFQVLTTPSLLARPTSWRYNNRFSFFACS